MKNLKFILKWTGTFVDTLTFLCGLTTLPFKKNLKNYEDTIDTVMKAVVYSAIGFAITALMDGLAYQ